MTTEAMQGTGRLEIEYLHRYWQGRIVAATGPEPDHGERDLEATLLSGLGINILEASRFVTPHAQPSFEALEEWVIETNGGRVDHAELDRLRDALAGVPVGSAAGRLDE